MQPIRFSVIGLNHGHIYGQVETLKEAGAEFVSFHAIEDDLAATFAAKYPEAKRVASTAEILEDSSIQVVASAAIPNERGPIGVQVMRHGKDFFSDKPGFTTLEQLEEARRVQAETGRIHSIFYSERLSNPATIKAGELVQSGAIGQVVQTIGLGPHRMNPASRASWFFEREKYGGIITDIASHQCEQFLFFAGSDDARVLCSQVANVANPQWPELEDFGDATVIADSGVMGYFRVDWFTPQGLPAFGDGRLTILGTEGYIEVRKYCDIGGTAGGNRLILVDEEGIHDVDCSGTTSNFGRQFIEDVQNRTATAMSQTHCFAAMELALKAQANATRLGNLR